MTDGRESCDSPSLMRASSSSLITAPSWSLGFGADHREFNNKLLDSSETDATHSSADSDAPTQRQLRLSLEIPTVYLTKTDPKSPTSKSSYHVYQLNIKSSSGEQWSVYRRYSQFLALHRQLRSLEPEIKRFKFPPKKNFNSKASTIVQDRRIKLEEYIKTLNNYLEKRPAGLEGSASEQQLRDFSAGVIAQTLVRASGSREATTTSSLSDSTRSEQLERRGTPTSMALAVADGTRMRTQSANGDRSSDANLDEESESLDSEQVDQSGSLASGPAPASGKIDILSLYYDFISLRDRGESELDFAAQLGVG